LHHIHARRVGFETVDLSQDASLADQIAHLLSEPEVDCAIDCVGFEARGHGHSGSQHEAPATVLNSLMEVTRAAGNIGIPACTSPTIVIYPHGSLKAAA
jgi:glutathione-independent formaldehyde dehydrogenase